MRKNSSVGTIDRFPRDIQIKDYMLKRPGYPRRGSIEQKLEPGQRIDN